MDENLCLISLRDLKFSDKLPLRRIYLKLRICILAIWLLFPEGKITQGCQIWLKFCPVYLDKNIFKVHHCIFAIS